MRLKVDKEKCSGCHLCEMACSLHHLGMIHVEKSAIRIHKQDLGSSLNTPTFCRQCKEMKCLQGEDVREHEERKKFTWNKGRAKRCPFEALPSLEDEAFHCDLCAGDPQCVKVCTPGALQITR